MSMQQGGVVALHAARGCSDGSIAARGCSAPKSGTATWSTTRKSLSHCPGADSVALSTQKGHLHACGRGATCTRVVAASDTYS